MPIHSNFNFIKRFYIDEYLFRGPKSIDDKISFISYEILRPDTSLRMTNHSSSIERINKSPCLKKTRAF